MYIPIWMIVVFGIFWFLGERQKKKLRFEHEERLREDRARLADDIRKRLPHYDNGVYWYWNYDENKWEQQ